MPIKNTYHGCQVTMSDDCHRYTVERDGKRLGEFETLAEAIECAKASDTPGPAEPDTRRQQIKQTDDLLDQPADGVNIRVEEE